MDTIGDAYIVAALLPVAGADGAGPPTARGAARVCEEVLAVAHGILAAVADYRAATGRAIHCRIGVATGPVLAGVLGRLQPRFHIFGQGLREAERCEQTGPIDAVHASPSVLAAVHQSLPPDAAAPPPLLEGIPSDPPMLAEAALALALLPESTADGLQLLETNLEHNFEEAPDSAPAADSESLPLPEPSELEFIADGGGRAGPPAAEAAAACLQAGMMCTYGRAELWGGSSTELWSLEQGRS
jgi:hypothetical protein